MQFIDNLIENSKPFKELEANVDTWKIQTTIEIHSGYLKEYEQKVKELVDLTTRVHNTILSVKHSQSNV